MKLQVVFSQEARDDLKGLYAFIAQRSGVMRAIAYVERIEDFYDRLSHFPHRGSRRDDIAAGLRVIGFERRVTVAFQVEETRVVLNRILYAGRDIGTAFASLGG